MRVQTKGKVRVDNIENMLKGIILETLEKAELRLDIDFKIQDLSCDVVFNINDTEQKITVNHGGLEEIFTVAVAVDETGDIIKASSNEKKSFIDEYVRREMIGQTKEYDTIESEYDMEDLQELDVNMVDDIKEVVYQIKGSDKKLIQYYKKDNLVGEVFLEK